MKINLTILTVLLFTSLTSCGSDKLSKDKAETIIRGCQTNESQIKTRTFYYGTLEMWDIFKKKSPDFMETQRKFEKLDFFKIGELQRLKGDMGNKDSYEVTLTSKGKEFLVKSKKDYKGQIAGKFRMCEYKFESVEEIHEISEQNIARVKIKIIRFNETPFFEESNNKLNPKEIFKTVVFRKTNEGWKLCDK